MLRFNLERRELIFSLLGLIASSMTQASGQWALADKTSVPALQALHESSVSDAFHMNPTALAAASLAMQGTIPGTLVRAVWTQDRELTKKLLAAGGDAKQISPGNHMPLIVVAAMQGDPKIITDLLSHGANVNAASKRDNPLYWAARQANLEAVRTLIANGADAKFQASDGGTVLHATLGDNNDIRIAKLLIEAGADIEAQHLGRTPLMNAAMFGRVEWVKLFIAHGAKVNTTTNGGATALAFSKIFGRNLEIERLLKEAGAH